VSDDPPATDTPALLFFGDAKDDPRTGRADAPRRRTDASTIDYDHLWPTAQRPTHGAETVMTERYAEHPVMFRNNPLGFILSLLLVPVGVGLLIFLVWHLKNRASKLVVTDRAVLYEKGLLSKERAELQIDSIRTVRVKQSFANRLFGTGTIELYTAGDRAEVVAVGMPDPNRVAELIKAGQDDGN
jgi:membrane protein YdbS with pleckstrin-like domain